VAREYRADPAGLFALKESVLEIDPARPPLPPAPVVVSGSGAGLLLVHGDRPGRWFPVPPRGASIVGRDAEASVPLAYDPFASGRHALLRLAPAGWTLTDLRSAHGTSVNFRRLGPGETVAIRSGDLLTVGRSRLLFRDGR
jgi:hypothetical protein